MKAAFAGLRHGHVFTLWRWAQEHPDIEIIGAWEQNAAAREAARERAQVEFTYDTFEALLADPAVEIVALGDCYGLRGREAIAALQAGKHIIADKPLCTSLEELAQIRRLSAEKKLKVSCMLDLRYCFAVQKARELVESGRLGAIHTVGFNGQHHLNYGVRPAWYFEEGMHGGTINDIAIHGVDLVRYITGGEFAKTLGARCWNAFAKEEPQFADCAQFMATLTDGTGVLADVSYAHPGSKFPLHPVWRFDFWGEKAMMELTLCDDTLLFAEKDAETPVIFKGEAPQGNGFDDLLADIAGTPTAHNTESVLRSTEAALRIQKFAQENDR